MFAEVVAEVCDFLYNGDALEHGVLGSQDKEI